MELATASYLPAKDRVGLLSTNQYTIVAYDNNIMMCWQMGMMVEEEIPLRFENLPCHHSDRGVWFRQVTIHEQIHV